MTSATRRLFDGSLPNHRVIVLSVALAVLLLAATLFPPLLFPLLLLLALDLALGPGGWVFAPVPAFTRRGSPLRASERGPPLA